MLWNPLGFHCNILFPVKPVDSGKDENVYVEKDKEAIITIEFKANPNPVDFIWSFSKDCSGPPGQILNDHDRIEGLSPKVS